MSIPDKQLNQTEFGRWLAALAVAVFAAAAYLPVLGAGFVWDDHVVIEGMRPLTSLSQAFGLLFTHAFAGTGDALAGERTVEYYRPLWICLVSLQRAWFGAQPLGYHLTSVALHAATSVAVLVLARELIADELPACFAALLFAVHPAHIEAVAWVSASNELLVGLLGVLFFIFYLRARRTGGLLNALPCLVAFKLALLSKETAIMLPLLALLWELLPAPGGLLRRLRWPFALMLVSTIYFVVRSQFVLPHPETHPLVWRLLTAPRLLAEYLRLLVLPLRLSVFHAFEFVTHPFDAAFLVPLFVVVCWCVVAVWTRRRAPAVFLGMAWTLVALLPVAGIVVVLHPALLAERYLYLPSVGPVIALGALLSWGARGVSTRKRGVWMAVALGLIVLGLFATPRQCRVWHDDITLMTRMVSDAPRAVSGHANLGAALERLGNIEAASREYRIAVGLAPRDHMMHRNLALTLGKLGAHDEAERELRASLALKPDYADARGDLGWLFEREARWDDARREYAEAVRMRPGEVVNTIGLGRVLVHLGQFVEAESVLAMTARQAPSDAGVHRALATLYEASGRFDECVKEAGLLRDLAPNEPVSHYDLGVALSRVGRVDDAAPEFEAALRLAPQWAKAHFNLGAMRSRQGRAREAVEQFDLAIRYAAPDSGLAVRAAAAKRAIVQP